MLNNSMILDFIKRKIKSKKAKKEAARLIENFNKSKQTKRPGRFNNESKFD